MADEAVGPNHEQQEYWSGGEGRHWIDQEASYDQMLAPFADALLDAAALESDDLVLDVGCGTGPTTCAAAALVPGGRAQGVDISAPMVAAARRRAERAGLANVSFEVADVQSDPLPTGVDVAISRFGVMFFADPVAAFTNIAAALAPGGRLAFVCWQPVTANQWLTVPMAAVAAVVGPPTPTPADAPGPFSLGDPDRIRSLLAAAGFGDVTVGALESPLVVGGATSLDDAVGFLATGRMIRNALGDTPPAAVERAVAAMRTALEPYAGPDGVTLGAATWVVRARRT